jgi:hypothetical protein
MGLLDAGVALARFIRPVPNGHLTSSLFLLSVEWSFTPLACRGVPMGPQNYAILLRSLRLEIGRSITKV